MILRADVLTKHDETSGEESEKSGTDNSVFDSDNILFKSFRQL